MDYYLEFSYTYLLLHSIQPSLSLHKQVISFLYLLHLLRNHFHTIMIKHICYLFKIIRVAIIIILFLDFNNFSFFKSLLSLIFLSFFKCFMAYCLFIIGILFTYWTHHVFIILEIVLIQEILLLFFSHC